MNKIIRLALIMNEPEIAQMAGDDLVNINRETQIEKVLEYKCIQEVIQLVLIDNRHTS
jgi:hypothetical protein